jgi:3-isopropylmalate dehydrogenase
LPTVSERVVLLPGDGIGPEVAEQARLALEVLAPEVALDERLIGAAAIRATGSPLPQETIDACLSAVAVLKGPVGDPEFEAAEVRPEQGLLALRAALDTYANLRPAVLGDVDVLIVRELVGGLYFGAKGVREDGTVFDTCEYHPRQVERIARWAFRLAESRRGLLTSVDKANVLETSRMWRRVVDEMAPEFPDVRVEHMLVDNAAMQLATTPQQFDVIVTENMFGDILSDLAAAVTGGLGMAPSASLSDGGPGLFEPVHGSAPDIAGRGAANPAAMLRSTALLLEYGLARTEEAEALHRAVEAAIVSSPTIDLGGSASTAEFGAAVREQLAVDGVASSSYGGS